MPHRTHLMVMLWGCVARGFLHQFGQRGHPFPPHSYGVVLSRFGAMFFSDPVAAFSNIGQAMQPGGWLVMVAWRSPADNEWVQEIFAALAVGREMPTPSPGAPGCFALADADRTCSTLTAARFHHIEHEAVDEPFWAGADAFGFFPRQRPHEGARAGSC